MFDQRRANADGVAARLLASRAATVVEGAAHVIFRLTLRGDACSPEEFTYAGVEGFLVRARSISNQWNLRRMCRLKRAIWVELSGLIMITCT